MPSHCCQKGAARNIECELRQDASERVQNGPRMKGLELLIRGLLAGLIIAVPVGPVNVLVMSRTLRKGWRSGLTSGLGAATADFLYGCIAGFSITVVIRFLV